MKTIHFCSGLPRTGSTVLMNILQQNPQVFTTGTCALPTLLKDHILVKSRFRECFQAMATHQADAAMYGLIHGASQGWFEGLTHKPVVISKNRGWSDINHLFPNSKTIACVRDIRDIIESFERVNSKIKALHSFGDAQHLYPSMMEVEKYDYFFKEGNAFSAGLYQELPRLMEIYKQDPSRVKFVRYEDLLKDPHGMLQNIYAFLGLSYYEHDLNHIEQSDLFEHDHAYFRERTDHHTQPQLMPWKEPTRSLSEGFHNKVITNHKWFYEGFYPDVLV